ncbi:MAG: hypothetical protein K6E84_06800 [Lachnospiraceae bacterium]|nr:hypothetical protein [Lachnospiraceae bacterium]
MKKKWIQLAVVLAVFAVAIGGVLIAKDNIVIYLGIRMFRLLKYGVIGAGVIGGAACLTSSAVTYSRMQDKLEEGKARQQALEEQHRRQTARLSMQDKLDSSVIRQILEQKKTEGWSSVSEDINECIRQLLTMDDYQDKLQKLLETNGADTLYDTEDVLDQAEQGILRNVRKVINYMEVSDSDKSEDTGRIAERLSECLSQNREILRQSQEFVFALTEYLNRQGDSGNDVSMLEIYKKTILEAISGE